MMSQLDQLVSQITLMGEGEQTQSKPKQAMSQVRRPLINDEGRYRQIQSEPNAQDLQKDRHGHLTDGRVRPFRGSQDAAAHVVCVRAVHNLELARLA